VQAPDIHYADLTAGRIAYQVWGRGDATLVALTNWSSNLDLTWTIDSWVDFTELIRPLRFIAYDQRGSGMSDRSLLAASIEEAAADLLELLDHLELDRPSLLAFDMATPTALAFAAQHPERVDRLVIWSGTAALMAASGYAVGLPAEMGDASIRLVREGWGHAESTYQRAGIPGEDREHERRQVALVQRQAGSPDQVDALVRAWFGMDAREYVPQVTAPTLVVHRTGDRLIPVAQARWLADHLPHANLLELPGDVHFIWIEDRPRVAAALLRFLGVDADTQPIPAKLLALVVTDIVDSTGRAARLGQADWRRLLDRHDQAIRRLLTRYDGVERGTAGDSFVATFGSAGAGVTFALAATVESTRLGLTLRAGVHVGDVSDRDGQLHGLAVHVATRVQTAAEPGQVLVTTAVAEALVGDGGVSLEPAGEQTLRGVPGSWVLWRATAL
jgi:pimeloyl-ACP methyl ester carboxylesterase